MNIYFDTETTGLKPGHIIQLSYIIEDESGVRGKNFFFDVDYIPYEAEAIHGFSTEKIHQLSSGHRFDYYIDEIADDFSKADTIVAHNVRFDLAFLTAEFSYLGREFNYNDKFDTMLYFKDILKIPTLRYGYKYPKLIEVGAFYELTDREVQNKSDDLYESSDLSAHDARFDTTMMYLCCKEGKVKFN